MVQYKKDVTFNNWVRNNCKPSKDGLNISDIDFVVEEYKKKKMMIIEVKTFGKKDIHYGQKHIYSVLNSAMKHSYPNNYTGCYLLVFSDNCPDSSEFIWIRKFIEEEGLLYQISKKSLKDFMDFNINYEELLKINNYL
jgi:hypothetical protein